jgi:hypothetical protein
MKNIKKNEYYSNVYYISNNDKYILYYFDSQMNIVIIELDEYFKIISKASYIIKTWKLIKDNFYHLIYNKVNYQLLICSTKKDNYTCITEDLIEKNGKKEIRNLNENTDTGDQPGEAPSDPNPNEGGQGGGGPGGSGPNDNQFNSDLKEGYSSDRPKGTIPSGYEFDFNKRETNIPRGEIKNNRDEIMSNLDKGESFGLKGDGYQINIAPMGQKEDGTSTSIDFGSCEQKLRESYNLSDSILTVFQTETNNNNDKSLTNKVQYVVYDENNQQLNLSICKDEKIRIHYSLKDNCTFDKDKFSDFMGKGIDILNSSDSFFNDICYSYSENGSDIILSDRISEIYQNYSLCDNGCEYEGMDTEDLTVSCSCNVSYDDTNDEDDDTADNIKEIILNLLQSSTFGVIKCYELVFSFTNKLSNIGFWVFLIIILAHIPLYVLFFIKGTKPIKQYIKGEMIKYNYIANIDNPPKKKDKKSENSENPEKNENFQKSENYNFAKNTNETVNKDENEDTDKKINFVIPNIVSRNENIQQKIRIEATKSNELIDTNSTRNREEANDKINVYNKNKELIEQKNNSDYPLIKMDANNTTNKCIPPESNYILYNYEYNTALMYEKRTFWRILFIVMISKNNILNTFILKCPL